MNEQRYNEQLQREEECNNCGYNKFLKEEKIGISPGAERAIG